jgi:tripeptide aminopeptidase
MINRQRLVSEFLALVQRAAANLGKPLQTRATGGGCDANVLNGRGLAIANLGCGMREIHTVNGWIDVNAAG